MFTIVTLDIIEIYQDYLNKNNSNDNPIEQIANHLDLDSSNEDKINEILNNSQKFIIAGKEIDKRILSVCAWLYENGINCKCITIKPFKNENDDNIYIDVNQIIPPYQIDDYYVNKKERTKKTKIYQPDDIINFFEKILSYVKNNSNLRINYNPRKAYCNITTGTKLKFTLRYFKRDNKFSIHALITDAQLKIKWNHFIISTKMNLKNY